VKAKTTDTIEIPFGGLTDSSALDKVKIPRSYFAGRSPAYSGPQRWDQYIGPMHQPRERSGIGRCVRCMCTSCRVVKGTVGVSSLSGIYKRAPSRHGLLSG